ncbi:nucleoid-associated protein [Undibacterium umbellatum]|uniref:Nucleoid-associated protein n=1 Tax=Undibacterium umbellatum TaxID=2762300 RepID=A0ABR6ZJY9_9BURK|nr:nucleoid-associated protein [Undibacterium umbellatum]MBC3911582.1 nucleoid-associated protein [Undibacterium umbellatum]
MQLINFSVDRIIIHQIFRNDDDGRKVAPTQSHEYTRFDGAAVAAFKGRVIDAIGVGSKAVEMEIVDLGSNGLPALIDKMADQNDDDFAPSSFDIAQKLNSAQHQRSIPGGIVVVFSGQYGASGKRYLGIIKADIHSAYEKKVDKRTNEISLKFVEEVLLTPSSRLYKTAVFLEKSDWHHLDTNLNNKWVVMVSDSQISQSDGKAAALYFYSSFLGCGYPQTSARTTKQFYDSTISFISDLDIPEAKKTDLLSALNTYLRVDASSTISADEFADRYFDLDTKDSFKSHLDDAGLPDTAFTKDIAHIESKLKIRRLNFSKNVKISAPSDVFKDSITFETIDGDLDATGAPAEWTKIIIKDRITHQE